MREIVDVNLISPMPRPSHRNYVCVSLRICLHFLFSPGILIQTTIEMENFGFQLVNVSDLEVLLGNADSAVQRELQNMEGDDG